MSGGPELMAYPEKKQTEQAAGAAASAALLFSGDRRRKALQGRAGYGTMKTASKAEKKAEFSGFGN